MTKTKAFLQKYLPLIAFCIAALWLFYQIYPIIFATHDDMRNYTLVRRGMLFSDALRSAKNGRISHLWNHLLLGAPYLANSLPVYKAIVYAVYLFDLFALGRLLQLTAEQPLAWMTALLCVSWSSVSTQHNLLISYALCHQLPVGLLCLSLCCFLLRHQKNRRVYTLLSCILLLFACMIYEAFTAAMLLFVLLALTLPDEAEQGSYARYLLRAVSRVLPQLIVMLCYMGIYFAWQHFYPPSYDGTSFDIHEPFLSLQTVWSYSTAFFPLVNLIDYANDSPLGLRSFLTQIPLPGWLTAALTAAGFAALLPRVKADTAKLRRALLLTFAGIFIPCAVIGFSKKYIGWVHRGFIGYLPSFYSFLFLTGFLAAAAVLIYRSIHEKHRRTTAVIVMTAFVFCMSLCASAANSLFRPYYAELSLRYRNFDRAVSAEIVTQCDDTWQLYAPDNAGIHARADYTEDYLKIYNSADVSYVPGGTPRDPGKNTLCFRSPADYAFAVLGKTDDALHAQTVTVTTVQAGETGISLRLTDGTDYTAAAADGTVLTAPAGTMFDLSVRPAHAET